MILLCIIFNYSFHNYTVLSIYIYFFYLKMPDYVSCVICEVFPVQDCKRCMIKYGRECQGSLSLCLTATRSRRSKTTQTPSGSSSATSWLRSTTVDPLFLHPSSSSVTSSSSSEECCCATLHRNTNPSVSQNAFYRKHTHGDRLLMFITQDQTISMKSSPVYSGQETPTYTGRVWLSDQHIKQQKWFILFI